MDSTSKQFGLMVAYLLPGFIVLAGIAPFAPLVSAWLQPLNQAQANLGAPVYAVLAATTIGMIVSCFRWLIIDHVHHWMGVRPPVWDDSRLAERDDSLFQLAVVPSRRPHARPVMNMIDYQPTERADNHPDRGGRKHGIKRCPEAYLRLIERL